MDIPYPDSNRGMFVGMLHTQSSCTTISTSTRFANSLIKWWTTHIESKQNQTCYVKKRIKTHCLEGRGVTRTFCVSQLLTTSMQKYKFSILIESIQRLSNCKNHRIDQVFNRMVVSK